MMILFGRSEFGCAYE